MSPPSGTRPAAPSVPTLPRAWPCCCSGFRRRFGCPPPRMPRQRAVTGHASHPACPPARRGRGPARPVRAARSWAREPWATPPWARPSIPAAISVPRPPCNAACAISTAVARPRPESAGIPAPRERLRAPGAGTARQPGRGRLAAMRCSCSPASSPVFWAGPSSGTTRPSPARPWRGNGPSAWIARSSPSSGWPGTIPISQECNHLELLDRARRGSARGRCGCLSRSRPGAWPWASAAWIRRVWRICSSGWARIWEPESWIIFRRAYPVLPAPWPPASSAWRKRYLGREGILFVDGYSKNLRALARPVLEAAAIGLGSVAGSLAARHGLGRRRRDSEAGGAPARRGACLRLARRGTEAPVCGAQIRRGEIRIRGQGNARTCALYAGPAQP